jgi:hypothetical protein
MIWFELVIAQRWTHTVIRYMLMRAANSKKVISSTAASRTYEMGYVDKTGGTEDTFGLLGLLIR